MPKVMAQGKTIDCAPGENLRRVLLNAGIDLHNGQSKLINCRGIGSCGTCAVAIAPLSERSVDRSPAEPAVSAANWRDRTRRRLPPHNPNRDLRLACQTQVLGDIRVEKYDGFWGQGDAPVWSG
ncbi:MAG: 2Fe-2S iron-sulfur cluster-binding protein [Cyanobacteria bacterium J06632_22]